MARNPKLRDAVAELRWLAARLEMLGGPPGPNVADHVHAMTRAILAQAIRVTASAIEEIERCELPSTPL